jgi:hypothetical protein
MFSSAWRRDSSVGLETGYALDGPDSMLASARYFSSPQRPDSTSDTRSHLPNGKGGGAKAAGA